MKKAEYFIIKLQIYPFDVMVSIEETDEILSKRLKKYGNTEEEISDLMNLKETTNARCIMLPSNQTVIRLKLQPKKYDMMGIVTHETFHATVFILTRIGMKLEQLVSCEAYAYLQQYLTEQIFRKLKI